MACVELQKGQQDWPSSQGKWAKSVTTVMVMDMAIRMEIGVVMAMAIW